MTKSILILGGYGNSGRLIADHLLRETDVRIVLAGRHTEPAAELATSLNKKYNNCDRDRVTTRRVDASSKESLDEAFRNGVDMVVVASSTTANAKQVAEAALDAQIDYFDIQISDPEKIQALRSLEGRIRESKCCFVTDGGVHPGVPGALVRYAASCCKELHTANVYGLFQMNWKQVDMPSSTAEEFIREMRDMKPLVFINGEWKEQHWSKLYRPFDFGPPFHTRSCVPMYMEEVIEISKKSNMQGVQEMGFYVAGFDWFTDYVVVPVAFLALGLFKGAAVRPMGKLLAWSLKTFGKAPFGSSVVLDAHGVVEDGLPLHFKVTVSHDDGYELTAIPAVAALLQILEDRPDPGLYLQAQLVETTRFLSDLKILGCDVRVKKEEDKEST